MSTMDAAAGRLRGELERLRALVEASRQVHASLDLDELLDNILAAATAQVGATRGTFYVCDQERRELWSRVTAGSERLEIRLPFGQGLAGHTAVSGEVLRVDDVHQHPLFDPEIDRRTGFRTENALCTPIRDADGRTVAVLQLLNKPGGFDADDSHFLELMSVQVAQALANAQGRRLAEERARLLKELDLARRIQNLLLPGVLPRLPGLALAARMVTSRQVGGDYYDVLALGGGRHLCVLADVSGKGVAAALVMSNLQAALAATARLSLELPAWAALLNETLFDRLGGSRYVTAVLMVVEPDARQLRYLNAGHPPALVRDGASIRRLASTGPPLGLLPAQDYGTGQLRLTEDAALLLYSDGLTEATDAAGSELGVDGVAALLEEVRGDDADVAVDRILAGVIAHGGNDPERDDRTLLLLKTVAV